MAIGISSPLVLVYETSRKMVISESGAIIIVFVLPLFSCTCRYKESYRQFVVEIV